MLTVDCIMLTHSFSTTQHPICAPLPGANWSAYANKLFNAVAGSLILLTQQLKGRDHGRSSVELDNLCEVM